MQVKVTRRSPFSGNVNTIFIETTEAEITAYNAGELIQVAFPNLSADEREFIKTGITPEEWAVAFGKE